MTEANNIHYNLHGDTTVVPGVFRNNVSVVNHNQSTTLASGDLNKLIERPWYKHYEWQLGVNTPTRIDISPLDDTLTRYLDIFSYYRAGVELTFKTNATRFHLGTLLFVWLPDEMDMPFDLTATDNWWWWSSMPHARVTAASAEDVKMVIPFASIRSYLRKSYNGSGPLGHLYVYPLNILSAATGSSTSIGVSIWGRFVDVEMIGPTVPTANLPPVSLQADICDTCTTDPCVCDTEGGVCGVCFQWPCVCKPPDDLEFQAGQCGICGNAACTCMQEKPTEPPSGGGGFDLFGTIGSVLSPITDVIGSIAEPLGSLGGLLGGILDKPDRKQIPQEFVRRTTGGFSSGVGESTARALALTPALALDLEASRDMPRLILSDYIKQYGIYDLFALDVSQPENTLVTFFSVNPCTTAGTRGLFTCEMRNYPLSFAAQAFVFWRGSIKYKFQVACSAFHQALLTVIWMPDAEISGGAVGGYPPNASYPYTQVFEVKGPSEFEFEVPWISEYPYKYVYKGSLFTSGSLPPSLPLSNHTDIFNGTINVFITNVITTAETLPSNFNLNIWAAAGDDFEMYYLDGENLANTFREGYTAGTYPVGEVELKNFETQADAGDIDVSVGLASTGQRDDAKEEQFETPNTQIISAKYFGDSHMDMYAVLKRYQAFASILVNRNTDESQHLVKDYFFIPVCPSLKYINNALNSTGNVAPNDIFAFEYSGDERDHSFFGETPLSHFSKMARFWRGGMRYRFLLNGGNQTSHGHTVKASFIPLMKQPSNAYRFTRAISTTGANLPTDLHVCSMVSHVDTHNDGNVLSTFDTQMSQWGVELEQIWQNGVLDVTVPYIAYRPKQLTQGFDLTQYVGELFGGNGGCRFLYYESTMTGLLCIQVVAREPVNNTQYDNGYYLEGYYAAGDDFELSIPCGAPTSTMQIRN